MPYITVTETIDVDIQVDLDQFDTDDLINEVEKRGHTVIELDNGNPQEISDRIYTLYRDYVDGSCFEEKLKRFFEAELGILIS